MYYSGAYWFLYSYIVFLLILPFLRLIIKDIQKKYIYYLLGICFLFQIIIPVFEKIFNLSPIALNISWLTSSIFLYPILGYYIDTMLVAETKMDKFVIVFPGIISFLCSITSSILGAIKDTFDESKLSIAGVFLTLLIFYGAK